MDRILSLRGKDFTSSLLTPEDALEVSYGSRGRRMSECRTSSTRSPKRIMDKKDLKNSSGRDLSFDVAQHARTLSLHERTESLEGKDTFSPIPFPKVPQFGTLQRESSLDSYFSVRNRRCAIDSSI
jgi:hypothetical protein